MHFTACELRILAQELQAVPAKLTQEQAHDLRPCTPDGRDEISIRYGMVTFGSLRRMTIESRA
jgi:hypothetical protein